MALKKCKRSRKSPIVGDMFRIEFDNGRKMFGVVIKAGIVCFRKSDFYVIYLWEGERPTSEQVLSYENMALPPLIVSKYMWTKGYFQKMDTLNIEDVDVMSTHFFSSDISCDSNECPKYFDENGEILKEKPKEGVLVSLYGVCTELGLVSEVERFLGKE